MDTTAAADFLAARNPGHGETRLLVVLGSGWGPVADAVLDIGGSVDYSEIPGFPASTVPGHAGRLVWGKVGGCPVWCMQGRFHYYEGYSMQQVTFPVRVFARLGVRGLLLTNAAGGIRKELPAGSLMLIRDHINFMGDHPLRGPNDEKSGPRFPDMTHAWDIQLRERLRSCAEAESIDVGEGVYLAVSGPSFETPAEIRAFSLLGADAVGMSTVPECLVARHAGMRVAGISCITNAAAHHGGPPLTHEEVEATALAVRERIARLFPTALPALCAELENDPHAC